MGKGQGNQVEPSSRVVSGRPGHEEESGGIVVYAIVVGGRMCETVRFPLICIQKEGGMSVERGRLWRV